MELNIKQFQQKSLRRQMSFVLQETVLFHAPVWQNIAYGKPNCTRAEIIKAAGMANASEFIEKLSDGYDTVLGERGHDSFRWTAAKNCYRACSDT